MERCYQTILILATAGLSWLLMMVFHECGHVLFGWLSGAQLIRVDLPPWGISQTDFATNPHPLFVAWGGVVGGCLLPLVLLGLVRVVASPYAYLAAWFAGFCLIANGAYLAGGSFFDGGADDAGVILHNGGGQWHLLLFGIPAVAFGLYLWSGLGPHFGFGCGGKVDHNTAIGMVIALLVVVCVEVAIRNT